MQYVKDASKSMERTKTDLNEALTSATILMKTCSALLKMEFPDH